MPDYTKVAFTSEFRYERVALKGHAGFSIGSGYAFTTVTIHHGLGYRPYVKAKYTYGSGKYFELFSGPSSYDIDGNGGQIGDVNVTDQDYIILVENYGIYPIAGTIYYRIYAEPQV